MLTYLPATSVIMSVVGTLMIFLFGMPFRVKPEGDVMVLGQVLSEPTIKEIRRHKFLNACSWLGLALVIAGGAIQFWYALPQ